MKIKQLTVKDGKVNVQVDPAERMAVLAEFAAGKKKKSQRVVDQMQLEYMFKHGQIEEEMPDPFEEE